MHWDKNDFTRKHYPIKMILNDYNEKLLGRPNFKTSHLIISLHFKINLIFLQNIFKTSLSTIIHGFNQIKPYKNQIKFTDMH